MDIVLITVDSLRYDYVYDRDTGDVFESLPVFRSLAEHGTNFANAFSNACYTKASFLSVLSGTFPWMFGSTSGGFDAERPHVAALLSQADYATGGFNTNPYLSSVYGYDRGFDYYMGRRGEKKISDGREETASTKLWKVLTDNFSAPGFFETLHSIRQTVGSTAGIQLGGDPYLSAEQLNDVAVRWVSETDGPRFLWIHYMDVHTPYYPHDGTISEGVSKRKAIQVFHRAHAKRGDVPEGDIRLLERLYRGEIEYLDRCLGELLDSLAEHMDVENSLVVLGADHGEAFKEHGKLFHVDGLLHDELIRVPLIVRGPGFGERTLRTPVSNVDIVPTLLAAADVTVPSVCVGADLSTLGESPTDERMVFTEAHREVDGKVAVTNGEFKLIRHLDDGTEALYNRYSDPDELVDIVTTSPDSLTQLRAALDEHVEMTRRHGVAAPEVEIDDNLRSQLRQLGYVE